MRPITIDTMMHVPREHLKCPLALVQDLTKENGAWTPPRKTKCKACKGKKKDSDGILCEACEGLGHKLGKEVPRFFAMADEDEEFDIVSVPRALDITPYLKRELVGKIPVQSELLSHDWWPKVRLGDGDVKLGPHEKMKYNQEPAWKALCGATHKWPGGTILGLKCGGGKALLNSEPVLTPEGFRPIGEVEVGDTVCGSDGYFHKILGVYPQGRRKMYRMRFTDGTSVVCDREHIWSFEFRRTSKPWTLDLTVGDLLQKNLRNKSGRLYYLPMVEPIQFPKKDLPVDPYTLGVLLGDGGISSGSSVKLTSMDSDMVGRLKFPGECRAIVCAHQNAGKATEYLISPPRSGGKSRNVLLDALKEWGLAGCRSHEKEIPEEYLYSHWEDRLSLLQGMLDTDGTPHGGACDFVTTSEILADEVEWLANSLGGTATRAASVRNWYTHNGEKKQGKPSYRIYIKLPSHLPMFRLERHLEKVSTSVQREPYRALDSIEEEGYGEATCIQVEADDHLYVTKNCILTHNTVLALKYAQELGVPTLVVCHTLNMARTWSVTASELWCINYPQEKHGFIGDGVRDWEDKDLVFSSQPGLLVDYPPEFWAKWGLVIFDEGDLLGASGLQALLPKFLGLRVLVTATLTRRDGNDYLYRMHVGSTCFEDIEQDLVPTGIILDSPVPRMVEKIDPKTELRTLVSTEQEVWSPYKKKMVPNLPKTISFIVKKCPERKTWAMKVVKEFLDQDRKVLFLGERVESLKEYHARAEVMWPEFKSGLVLGSQHQKLEESERALKESNIIWGIQQLAKRGMNQPDIDTGIVEWLSFNDPRRWQQTVGRILRFFAGKKDPIMVMLNDANVPCLDRKAEDAQAYFHSQGYGVEWYDR